MHAAARLARRSARPLSGVGRETAARSRPIEQSTRPAGWIGPGMAAEGGWRRRSGSRTGKASCRLARAYRIAPVDASAPSIAPVSCLRPASRARIVDRTSATGRPCVRPEPLGRRSHRRKYPLVALSWSAPAAEQWRSGGKALSPAVVWPPPPLVGGVATVVNRPIAAVLGPARHPLSPRAAVPDQPHVRHRRRRHHRHQPSANRRDELLPATGTGNSRRHRRRRLSRNNKVRWNTPSRIFVNPSISRSDSRC